MTNVPWNNRRRARAGFRRWSTPDARSFFREKGLDFIAAPRAALVRFQSLREHRTVDKRHKRRKERRLAAEQKEIEAQQLQHQLAQAAAEEAPAVMFYACVAIVAMFFIIIACLVIAIIDLETYNFGLYIVLLCIVGTMLACALCIANPNACPNPDWYSRFCLLLQEMHPDNIHLQNPQHPKLTGLRAQFAAHYGGGQSIDGRATSTGGTGDESKMRQNRATVAMLAPAVNIMHQVWKGMAWVAEEVEDETEMDETTAERGEMERMGLSVRTDSGASSLTSNSKRLSVIPESGGSPLGSLDQLEVFNEITRVSMPVVRCDSLVRCESPVLPQEDDITL